MKIISKNLIFFATLVFILTLLFRFGLSSLLTAEKYTLVMTISVFYGILMFFSGWLTGRREGKENFFFDAGFRWNLTTFLVFHLVSLPWFWLGLNSDKENIQSGLYIAMMIWGGFLILHLILFLILRRKTIKGVHKSDIFK